MSPTLVIAAREIRERRFILVTALVLGLLPFALALVPSLSGPDTDARDLSALLLSLAFPPAVAFAVGASILGRDLAERRIGFYFARPISAFGLWAGKCLGAVVLVLLSVVLVAGPVASVNGTAAEFATGKIPFPLRVLAPGLFLFIGSAHVAASAYRSRSPLIVLDIAFAATALALFGRVMMEMVYAGAGAIGASAQPGLVAAFAAALLLAPAVQLGVGRADPRRGHAALSTAVWGLGGAVLLAFFLWSRWVLGVTPQQAGGVAEGVAAAPSAGAALLFNGTGRAPYSPVFVMDGSTGVYVRFSGERMSVPAFTRDGRAAWFARRPEGLPHTLPTLAVARFDGGRPRVDEIQLQDIADDARVLALDLAAARAVLADRSSVALIDTTTGQTVGRTALPGTVAADFRHGGVLRLLQDIPYQPPMPFGGVGFAVSEWDSARSSLTERWHFQVEGPCRTLAVRGDRVFATSNGRDGLLIDLESGTRTPVETPWTKAAPDVRPGWRTPMLGVPAQFLSGGHLAFGSRHELWLVGAKGSRVVRFGEGDNVWTIAETVPGELAVGLLGGPRSPRRTVILDPATGLVRGEEKGLTPAGLRYLFFESGGRAPEAGSFASRLFIDVEGALIERRPDGSRRIVVAAPEP